MCKILKNSKKQKLKVLTFNSTEENDNWVYNALVRLFCCVRDFIPFVHRLKKWNDQTGLYMYTCACH